MVGQQEGDDETRRPEAHVPAKVPAPQEYAGSRQGCDEATIELLQPFLKGKGELPTTGLPENLSVLLKAWADRAPLNH